MKIGSARVPLVLVSLAVSLGCSHSPQKTASQWNPKTAAVYLDQREAAWAGWIGSARDQQTFCVSCHTAVPYAFARPMLRTSLREEGPSSEEVRLVANVVRRVKLWNQIGPYYDYQGTGSRGTEAILNALILAHRDAQAGHLDDLTRTAFENMWMLQQTEGANKGAWAWLQFGMEPWEATDSQYYGAALAALATGVAPDDYRSTAKIQNNLNMLRDYLNREYYTQSALNHAVLLWVSLKLPGLIDSARRDAIIGEIRSEQQDDGGWRLAELAWPNDRSLHSMVRRHLRSDWTRQDANSDGYATGLITFVLEEAGMPANDKTLEQGLAWLARNQNPIDGSWTSWSLTQNRRPDSMVGHFMRDAATAYAVLALTAKEKNPGTTQASSHN